MTKWRQRSRITVEAVRYWGDNVDEVKALVSDGRGVGVARTTLVIKSSAGVLKVERGEWVVRDMHGEFAVFADEDFHKLFESVEVET